MPVTWELAAGPEGAARAAKAATRRRQAARQEPEGAASPEISYDEDELRSFFTLTTEDLELVRTARSPRNQLGLTLLLAWMRAERRAVSDPAMLPGDVIAFVARQLDVAPEVLEGYGARRATRTAHVATVCRHLGLRALTPADEERLDAFLHEKAAQTGRASALAEAADDWLFSESLLRPAQDRVDRLVRHARAEAEEELFLQVCRQLTQEEGTRLDALCDPTGQGDSPLALLRTPPRAPSAGAIRLECWRLASIRSLFPDRLDWGPITTSRRRQWAAVVRRLYARDLSRYPPPKRRTLMLAFLNVRAEEVTDAIVEMFDVLVGRMFTRAGEALTEVKARQTEAHAENARLFPAVAEILLDVSIPPSAVRQEVFRHVPRERLGRLVEESRALDRGETHALFDLLRDRFPYLRSFVPEVLATLRFEVGPDGHDLARGIETLRAMGDAHRRKVPADASVTFVPRRWAPVVTSPEGVDRRAWELSLVSEMRAALRARAGAHPGAHLPQHSRGHH